MQTLPVSISGFLLLNHIGDKKEESVYLGATANLLCDRLKITYGGGTIAVKMGRTIIPIYSIFEHAPPVCYSGTAGIICCTVIVCLVFVGKRKLTLVTPGMSHCEK